MKDNLLNIVEFCQVFSCCSFKSTRGGFNCRGKKLFRHPHIMGKQYNVFGKLQLFAVFSH